MSNNEVIEYLKKSPVFASSLGSKELFHSNIWAYLIQQNHRYLTVFFDDYDYESDEIVEDGVYRERLNMDLIIKTKANIFVIENKIKSLPRKAQLDEYKSDLEKSKEFPVPEGTRYYCLTGIPEEKPEFLKDPWKYINYRKIAERIRKITKEISQDEGESHFSAFALDYSDMIQNLCDLLESKEKELKDVFYFPQNYENDEFEEIRRGLRIDDILQKINADQFTTYVRGQLKVANICGFEDHTGYTNQRSLSEFYFMVGEKDEDDNKSFYLKIGVQIQNTMFRWFAETNNYKIKSEKVFKAGKASAIRWFFEKKTKGKIATPIGQEKKTGMTKQYLLFKPMFVYQYYSIDPEECSIDTLAKTVVSFMKKAETIKDVYAKKLAENRR